MTYDELPMVLTAAKRTATTPSGPPSEAEKVDRDMRIKVRWCACNSRLPFKWCHGRVPGAPAQWLEGTRVPDRDVVPPTSRDRGLR